MDSGWAWNERMSSYNAHEDPPSDEHLVGASVDFNMNGVSFSIQQRSEDSEEFENAMHLTIPWEALGFKSEQGTNIGTALHTTESVEVSQVDKGDVMPTDNPFDSLIRGLRSSYDAESVFWMMDDAYDRLDQEMSEMVSEEPNVSDWAVVDNPHGDNFVGQVIDQRVSEVKVSPDKDARKATWCPIDNVTAYDSYPVACYENDDLEYCVTRAIQKADEEIIDDEDVASVIEDVIELTSGRATQEEVKPVVEAYFE